MPTPIEMDADVERFFAWLHTIPEHGLGQRLEAAKAHFAATCLPNPTTMIWPDPMELLPPGDRSAGCVLQAYALIRDRRFFNAHLGSRLIPFFKSIGLALPELDDVEGARLRASEFLNPRNEHPESSLLELAVAARYLREGYQLRFIPESSQRTPDIELLWGELDGIQIECKRLRPSEYERDEARRVRGLFATASQLALERGAFVHLDVMFKAPLSTVPETYLLDHMGAALDASPVSKIWDDAFSRGQVVTGDIEALRDDTAETYLLVGPKLFRLFTGTVVPSQRVILGVKGRGHELDARYLDAFEAVALCSWDTESEESKEARARNIRTKLADIDRQLSNSRLAAAHIVVDAERDAATADARRSKIREAVTTFRFYSPIISLTTHYLLTHTAEGNSWTIDETADPANRLPVALLDDPRLLPLGEELGIEPAWRYAGPE